MSTWQLFAVCFLSDITFLTRESRALADLEPHPELEVDGKLE
jgi:hypothetical protein